MYSIRRVAFRALSLKPSTSFNLQARKFSQIIDRTPAFRPASSILPRQQLRWLADEAPAKVAEESAAAEAEEEPPKTEEQAVAAAAEEPTTTESIETPNQVDPPSPFESFQNTAADATESVKETLSNAAESVSSAVGGTATAITGKGDSENSNIYVGNLFFDVRSEDLERHFAKVGQVVSAKVITDVRGLSKGFGYIEFSNPAEAADAIQQFHLQNFEGRRLNVAYAQSRGPFKGRNNSDGPSRSPRSQFTRDDKPQNEPTRTLFIGNMSFDMSDRDLNQLFRSVKNVVDVRVAIDRRTGQPRGFAHADFIDIDSATSAMEELRGKVVLGRQLRIDYSLSTGRAALNADAPKE